MRKSLLAGAALAGLLAAGPAMASDLSQWTVSNYNWSGPYAGLEFGGGFGESHTDFTPPAANTGRFDANGVIGGGTLGYNWDLGQFVPGVETDFSGTSFDGSAACSGGAATCKTSNPWLGTVRGRLGYKVGRFLPYVTGGLAYGRVDSEGTIDATGAEAFDHSRLEPGWTVGAGIEAPILPAWSIKAEYLHVRFADMTTPGQFGASQETGLGENIFRVGLNYRFDTGLLF